MAKTGVAQKIGFLVRPSEFLNKNPHAGTRTKYSSQAAQTHKMLATSPNARLEVRIFAPAGR